MKINSELRNLIYKNSPGLEVISPESFRKIISKEIKKPTLLCELIVRFSVFNLLSNQGSSLIINLNLNITKNLNNNQVKCSSCGSKMDLNELVVQQIINSEKEKISNGFDERLKKALAQQKNKLNHGHQSEINSITKELKKKMILF